jgi:glutathionylspermidine synthase
MKRVRFTERSDWREKAEEYGFPFHTSGGEIYWDETTAWSFSLREVEDDIEAPTAEIESMCNAFVARAVGDEAILKQLAIPEAYWGMIRNSWKRGDRNLYGRFDFAYNGSGPAKLLEYNADTPTSLFEAAIFQWSWFEDQLASGQLAEGTDQFNSIHERLVSAFSGINRGDPYNLHLTHTAESAEDAATVAYLADCARQGGIKTKILNIEDIGISTTSQLTDKEDGLIQMLFKLYPWEWLFREEFGKHLPGAKTQFIEPPWKAILSSKALLPFLWEIAPNHPNLLECYFSIDPRAKKLRDCVTKPIHSREGANISVTRAGVTQQTTSGAYTGDSVVQALADVATFEGGHAVIGSWVIAGQPAGIGIREDAGWITRDTARFVPHFIEA